MNAPRAQWGSRLGFILAASGSAVGLGNIWKFPYITGENGGGLFVLIYLVCIGLVGIPIMMAEIMIGRAAQKQPVGAFEVLQDKRTTGWASIGWLGVAAGFVIASFYIVVAGWSIDYALKSVVNFTKPIHDDALLVAAEYRATASLDDMRATLVERTTDKEHRTERDQLRRQLPVKTWEAHARYLSALDKAGDKDEARRRLRMNADLARKLVAADEVSAAIDAGLQARRNEVRERYAAMADEQVLDEAEDLRRRQAVRDRVQSAFLAIATDGWTSSFWALLFMLVTILIVARGVAKGIEKACRVLMPTLIILMLFMVGYAAFQPGFGEAVAFVFKPDPTKLKPSGVLEALGHAFFTLSLGMGAMITYGSYQATKTHLAGQSALIALLDTGIALIACLMIFPIIFSYDQDAGAGPGLVFMSMPLAFSEMPWWGVLLGILFFGLLVFAALTSAISLLEVVCSYFIDQRGWSRPRAAWAMGGAIFLFSLPSAFAMDPDILMSGWEPSYGQNFFDSMDYLSSNWMLPLGGLLIAIYAGWVMPKRLRDAEVADLAPSLYTGWLLLVRFVAPALVFIVLLQKVGILDADDLFHGLFN